MVTGASAGIGRATSLLFAAEGATVVAADIDDAGGRSLEQEGNGDIRFQRCDVSRVEDIKALMDVAAAISGGIDVVVNNAGAPGDKAPIDQIEADGWDRTMDLLLRSAAMGIRYAVPHMKGRDGASIVNISSVAAAQAGSGPTVYSVAKAGVVHLTKLAATDLARYGIRVNAVAPGLIATNIFAAAFDVGMEEFAQIKPELDAYAIRAQPVARTGEPIDIAEMVLFLAGSQGRFITGANFAVDGGMTLGSRNAWDPDMPKPLANLRK